MATYGGTSLSEFIAGSGLSDLISGLGGNDTLEGGGLNDTLDGGTGTDSMVGGDGNDLYIVDSTKDIVTETAGSLHDRIQASISIDLNNTAYDGIEHVTLTGSSGLSATGDAGKNVLIGNTGANHIDGRDGADTMIGGDGSDTYTSDIFQDVVMEFDGGGTDTLISTEDFFLGAFIENLTFVGTLISNGIGNDLANRITGSTGQDLFAGEAGNDTLTGNDGDDILTGGAGDDSMVGGRANDQYDVDDIGDRITEAGLSTDVDTVDSAISYVLGANLENLFLSEDDHINGTGNTLNNVIEGADGRNILSGLAGNDSINGALGEDVLLGGDGNDTLTADGEEDTLVGGAGIDIFKFVTDSIDSDCIAGDISILPGGDLIDISELLTAVTAATVSGFLETKVSGGSTLLRIDVDGGANKFVDLVTLQGVTTDLNGLIANAALLGIGTLTATPLLGANGNDTLAGGATSTLIQGLSGNDSLTGGAGFDTLDGGAGTDTLTGGAGGDTYILDSTKDVIVDTAGKDRILASFTVDLDLVAYDGIEHATLTGTAAINASGDAAENMLIGNTNVNRLDGRGGIDTLIGGLGSDIYTVDARDDIVVENPNEGTDTVNSTVDYDLSADVEKLVLLGTDAISGTGNDLANTITGNSGQNMLIGNGGNDTLTGNDGNDFLIAGFGADSMVGGQGSDLYRVDETGDRVVETGSATDVDVVESTITYSLGSTIENLTLLNSTLDINGTGNGLANTIIGNEGANQLSGLGGNDTIDGGVDSGGDILLGGDGNDTFRARCDGDVIVGGNGNDIILFVEPIVEVADAVVDFSGVPGADVLDVSPILTNVTPATVNGFLKATTSQGITTIEVDVDGGANKFQEMVDLLGVSTDLDGLMANGALAGVGAVLVAPTAGTNAADTLTGGVKSTLIQGLGGNDSLTGGAGFDTLDGGTGFDTLAGAAGSDTYIVDSTKDVIVETSGTDDRINASITIDLSAVAYDGIEHVTLTGTANLNATGDEFVNFRIRNSGINRLDGKAGDDLMMGRGGNDIYEVDSSGDEVAELSGEGTDEVHSSALDYHLGSFVENLVLTGTADINGDGNEIANRITGNAGANLLEGEAGNDTLTGGDGSDTLDGGEGADSMVGGFGNDEYHVDDIGDRITEVNEAIVTDSVISTISYTLGANLEALALVGSTGLKGTGNSVNNAVLGASGDDTLSGLAGNDFLWGDSGDDVMLGGDGADTLRVSSGIDTLVGGAGNDVFQVFNLSDIDGLDVIADFSATSGGDRLDLKDILSGSGYDPVTSNINDFLQCISTSDGTKVRVDVDGGGDNFVDLVNLVGVSTDVMGLLNNGNLELAA